MSIGAECGHVTMTEKRAGPKAGPTSTDGHCGFSPPMEFPQPIGLTQWT